MGCWFHQDADDSILSDASVDTDEYYNSTMSDKEEKKKRKMKEQEEENKRKMNAWMAEVNEKKKTKREVPVESSPVSSRPQQQESQEEALALGIKTSQYYGSTTMDSREKKQTTHKHKKKKNKTKKNSELSNESCSVPSQPQQQQEELIETERWRETASPWDVSTPQKHLSEYYNLTTSDDDRKKTKKKKTTKREVSSSSVSSQPQHQEQHQQEELKEVEQWRKRASELGITEPKKYMSKTITTTDARTDQNRYEVCLDEFSEWMPMLELAIKANSKDREVKVNVLDRLGREYTFIFAYIKSNGRYRFRGREYSKFLVDNRVEAGQKMTVWGLPDETGENYGFAFVNK